MILEASCVNVAIDSEAVEYRKIQDMWLRMENQLICNSTRFDVQNGSIIKYAINTLFDHFVEDIQNWGVNLNRVDASDGRTVLDYVRDRVHRSREHPSSSRRFQSYYNDLRAAGARHRSELR
jgi:hypothetical protein